MASAAPADGTGTRYAHESIAKGSKSFAAAARLLPPAVREDVVRLYAWCRHCDDVIDGQTLGHGESIVEDRAARLADLTRRTDAALAGAPTGAAVFDGFADVARRVGIAPVLAHDHLAGFAMDVAGASYGTMEDLAAYCYGVAGSVGVMMALTMGVPRQETDTLDRACDLGLAFQMTNIARDVSADAAIGRVYLPADLLADEGLSADPATVRDDRNAAAVYRATARLLEEAERYYASASVGIARLPFRAAWAIASARAIYRAIGTRRRVAGPEGLSRRVGTSRGTKLVLLSRSAITAARRPNGEAPRENLWTRPRREGT